MRKVFVLATLLCTAASATAQEKVMDIRKSDGTTVQTRVAELAQISFLTAEEGTQGIIVKTLGGETAAVSFQANPIVTVSNGKLSVKPKADEAIQFEITDIAEILFGDTADATGISAPHSLTCVLEDGGVLLRGIPQGIIPCICSIDGRSIPTPPMQDGEMRLSRATLGTGIFIVKAGTFSAKIKL